MEKKNNINLNNMDYGKQRDSTQYGVQIKRQTKSTESDGVPRVRSFTLPFTYFHHNRCAHTKNLF